LDKYSAQNTWPGTDLVICPQLALDFHSKSWGLSSSMVKDKPVWTSSADLLLC